MIGDFIDNFDIPEVARTALKSQGYHEQQLEDGVSVYAGHDKGVAYRFYTHAEYNAEKSRKTGIECFDDVEMIEWIRDRRTKPTERVRFLPETLLAFDADGNCVGGSYAESYIAYKKGKKQTGASLEKWGLLSTGEVATLAAMGIYTIEQLAAQPEGKFGASFPVSIHEAYTRAKQWVAGESARTEAAETKEEVETLKAQNAALLARLEALEEDKVAGAVSASKGKKRGRPKGKSKAKAKSRG